MLDTTTGRKPGALIEASFWIKEQGAIPVANGTVIVTTGKDAPGASPPAGAVIEVVNKLPLSVSGEKVSPFTVVEAIVADASANCDAGSASEMVMTVPAGIVPVVPTMLGVNVKITLLPLMVAVLLRLTVALPTGEANVTCVKASVTKPARVALPRTPVGSARSTCISAVLIESGAYAKVCAAGVNVTSIDTEGGAVIAAPVA